MVMFSEDLTELSIKFRKVSGYFYCSYNQLTSCPEEVDGDFSCTDNLIISLEGGPEIVGGSFNCIENELTSLEGGPEVVGGNFYCSDNKLTTLKVDQKK